MATLNIKNVPDALYKKLRAGGLHASLTPVPSFDYLVRPDED